MDAVRKAMRDTRGPGGVRNLFLYSPNGNKDGFKVIPIAGVAAREEVLHMKTVTRDGALAAHRVPPKLLGIVPSNSGGFGDVEKAADVFARQEILPLATMIASAINDWIGEAVVGFGGEMSGCEERRVGPKAAWRVEGNTLRHGAIRAWKAMIRSPMLRSGHHGSNGSPPRALNSDDRSVRVLVSVGDPSRPADAQDEGFHFLRASS